MGAKTTYRTDAIVLKSNDYGEADQIVSFYTREFGKMKGIAKGARRSRRRFVNALDIFCCSRLTFTRRSPGGLAFLDDCTVVHHFEDVRNSVEKTATAFYLVELIEAFTMEGKPNNALYEFLTEAMDLINEKDCHEGITRFMETRILMLSGYDPVLDRCLRCGYTINPKRSFSFSPRDGGLICHHCQPSGPAVSVVSIGTAKALLLAKRCPLPLWPRIALSPQSAREAEHLLRHFITHLLGRELRSLDVLRQVRQFAIDTSRKNK